MIMATMQAMWRGRVEHVYVVLSSVEKHFIDPIYTKQAKNCSVVVNLWKVALPEKIKRGRYLIDILQ